MTTYFRPESVIFQQNDMSKNRIFKQNVRIDDSDSFNLVSSIHLQCDRFKSQIDRLSLSINRKQGHDIREFSLE
ncbi:hypothetical protein DERF_006254 [Dermatophagoides farinae]|uniref:Uncharacterized protein n=1 Tax=Dermatophagoides farinae TaxID=6954 RepID=A0A922I8M6_DERFA|nr:hypothetical protein DERF_006254 [Dermatophagoides farinae]